MTRIQHRRGTATQWTTANPILAAGEKGVETDTGKEKTGNGVNTWNDLPYFLNEAQNDERYVIKGEGGAFEGDADDIADGTTKVVMTKTERTKLSDIQSGATANAPDADLLDRGNHTGEQEISTVTGLQEALAARADKAGSVKQFQDWSDEAPSDGLVPVYDSTPGAYVPTDLGARFAEKDATGRIEQSALPLFNLQGKVIQQGDPIPETLPPGSLVVIKASVQPPSVAKLKEGYQQASGSLALVLDEAVAVGDKLLLAAGASNEATPQTMTRFQASFSAGDATATWLGLSQPNVSAATALALIEVTTAMAVGTTITLTAHDSTGAAINRPHIFGSLMRLKNVTATTPQDQIAIGGGNSTTSMTAVKAGPTSAPTSQAVEIAIGVVVWNSGAGTVSRTMKDNINGWTQVTQLESDLGTSARSLFVAYNLLSAVGPQTFETEMTSSDGATGQWATTLVTFKGA